MALTAAVISAAAISAPTKSVDSRSVRDNVGVVSPLKRVHESQSSQTFSPAVSSARDVVGRKAKVVSEGFSDSVSGKVVDRKGGKFLRHGVPTAEKTKGKKREKVAGKSHDSDSRLSLAEDVRAKLNMHEDLYSLNGYRLQALVSDAVKSVLNKAERSPLENAVKLPEIVISEDDDCLVMTPTTPEVIASVSGVANVLKGVLKNKVHYKRIDYDDNGKRLKKEDGKIVDLTAGGCRVVDNMKIEGWDFNLTLLIEGHLDEFAFAEKEMQVRGVIHDEIRRVFAQRDKKRDKRRNAGMNTFRQVENFDRDEMLEGSYSYAEAESAEAKAEAKDIAINEEIAGSKEQDAVAMAEDRAYLYDYLQWGATTLTFPEKSRFGSKAEERKYAVWAKNGSAVDGIADGLNLDFAKISRQATASKPVRLKGVSVADSWSVEA